MWETRKEFKDIINQDINIDGTSEVCINLFIAQYEPTCTRQHHFTQT